MMMFDKKNHSEMFYKIIMNSVGKLLEKRQEKVLGSFLVKVKEWRLATIL